MWRIHSRAYCYLFSLAAALFLTSFAQAAIQHKDVLAGLPLRFEENRGQAEKPAAYIAHGAGYRLAVEATANTLSWTDSKSNAVATLRTRFVGANRRARVEALEPQVVRTSYFIGRSAESWHADIPNYSKVRVDGMYPGIDLVFHGSGGTLEYDFVVSAGSDPSSIQFDITGAERVSIDQNGDLVLATSTGDVRWKKPDLYQDRAGTRTAIEGRFAVSGRRVRFVVGAYDRARELVIDPALFFATYFGSPVPGSGYEGTAGVGTDASGNVYIVGLTGSNNLQVTQGVVQPGFGGGSASYGAGDVFVAKFSPAGAVLYVTYLGGTGDDYPGGIFVDAAGNAYLTGYTNSGNFPIFPATTAAQINFGGSGGNDCFRTGDAFVTKLNPTGTQIIYSTYFGGSLDDEARGITVDGSGNAYIAGATRSSDMKIVGGFQTTNKGFGGEPGKPACNGGPAFDTGDAFIAKFNATGTQVLYSTFLGGSMDDGAAAIGLDAFGNIYVAGATLSTDFPTTAGVMQRSFGGEGDGNDNPYLHFGDAWVAKISSAGTLVYSSYFGQQGIAMRGEDSIDALVVNGDGTIWVGGATTSVALPVTSTAVQKSFGGYYPDSTPFFVENDYGDGFIAKIDANGANILYATFVGGSGNDGVTGLIVGPTGLLYAVGATDSTDFPTTSNAVHAAFLGDNNYDPDPNVPPDYAPTGDGFFVEIDPTSSQLVYSTYLGGMYDDYLSGLSMDPSGNVWLAGGTRSPDVQTTSNAPQQTYTGGTLTGGEQGRAMVFGFSSGVGTLTTSLAHVADGNGFRTQVLLINTGTAAANYSLQFFDQNGIRVTYALGAGQSMSGTIQPGAEAIVQTQGQGRSTNLGWGQLTAPSSVKGMLIYQQQASSTSLQEGSAPITAASNNFFVPIDDTAGEVTSIGFANPSSSQTANVTFTTTYDTFGNDTTTVTLNPLQQMAQPLTSLIPNAQGRRGLMQVSSNTPISLVAFRFQGAALTLFDTIPPSAGSGGNVTSTIAHVADGNNFRTTIILTNSSTASQSYTLGIYNAQGQTQTFGFDTATPLQGTVPGSTTLTLNTTGLGSVTNLGWAQLTAPPSVGGIAVFRQTDPGLNEQQATIPISQTILQHFWVPFDNLGNTTSIALANPDPSATATINVTFRYTDGTSNTGQMTLANRNYMAQQLAQLFPQVTGKAGVAEFMSNTPIAIVEVRFNPTQAFTSLRAVGP